MKKCPKCRNWTLDFDGYFGRFRCLNPECGWMAPSTAEREIRLLQTHGEPTILESVVIPELRLRLTPSYDRENDALSVDFGLDEPTFDLPEPDGIMIWRIGRRSDMVAGFTIVGVREGAISQITIELIAQRKDDIEQRLRRMPTALSKGRATKSLVEEVVVTALTGEQSSTETKPETENAWSDVVKGVQALIDT